MSATLLSLGGIALAASVAAAQPRAGAPPPKPIPANYVQVSPCIPEMGIHYADPKRSLAGSTIYGVMNGKPSSPS